MAPRGRRSPSKAVSMEEIASSSDLVWKFTKVMNMRDLSRDDDYLSHLFVEKLGTAVMPLMVHKMDPLRRLPKTDAAEILATVQRLIHARPTGTAAVKQAVSELLAIPAVLYFIRDYDQSQINAFATHASRYMELYLPTGSIEIAQTSRYSKWTGKAELCILATRPLPPGHVISELKGSMADLTEEEDKELKRTGARDDGGVRRDFSVIHSKQMKKNHLFLGPARFVNHDCDHNCELFRTGRYITFRVIKPIAVGQEVTAHYGDGYFGRNNRHCLCETCETLCRGGYGPQTEDDDLLSDAHYHSDSDSDTSSASSTDLEEEVKVVVNVNQRSTRRGVYLTLPQDDDDSSDSDGAEAEIEVDKVLGTDTSDLTPAPSSAPISAMQPIPTQITELTNSTSITSEICPVDPPPERDGSISQSHMSRPSPVSSSSASSITTKSTFKSVITTRSQKARGVLSDSNPQLITPPLSDVPETESSISTCPRSQARLTVSVDDAQSAIPAPASNILDSKGPEALTAPILPVKRGRGRPRKYPLPEGAVAPVPKPKKTPVPITKPEPRVLRARPSSVVGPIESKAALTPAEKAIEKSKLERTRLCFTCFNALPVVEPTSTSVSASTRKGKCKEVREECTRCKRHSVIYGVPWPSRNPTTGSGFLPTPREDTPSSSTHKITHRDLPILDRKLQAVYNSHKRQRSESEDREPKRRKITAQRSPCPPTHTTAQKPRKILARRRVPNTPLSWAEMQLLQQQEYDRQPTHMTPKQMRKRLAQNRAPSPNTNWTAQLPSKLLAQQEYPRPPIHTTVQQPRKILARAHARGPTRTIAQQPIAPSRSGRASVPTIKVREREKTQKPENVVTSGVSAISAQPRDNNGRFGKKEVSNGRYRRKKVTVTAGSARMSRAQRGLQGRTTGKASETLERTEVLEDDDKDAKSMVSSAVISRVTRRTTVNEIADISHTKKKQRQDEPNVIDDRRDKTFWPALPSLPPCGSGFKRLGMLNQRPNPALVSRWRTLTPAGHSTESTPTLLDDTTDDETKSEEAPATPEGESIGMLSSSPKGGKRLRGEETPRRERIDVIDADGSDAEKIVNVTWPARRTSALPYFKGLGLYAKPNPITFSKRTWAPQALPAEDDADDDRLSRTPLEGEEGEHKQSQGNDSTSYAHVGSPDLSSDTGDADSISINTSEIFYPQAPKSPMRVVTFDLGSQSSSSGDEDGILPDSPDSYYFTLQRTVNFADTERPIDASPAASTSSVNISKQAEEGVTEVTLKVSPSFRPINDGFQRQGLSPVAKDLKPFSNYPMKVSLPSKLRSSFLPSASPVPVSSRLVEAGWASSEENL